VFIIVLTIKIELFDESPVSPMMEKLSVLFDLATSKYTEAGRGASGQ